MRAEWPGHARVCCQAKWLPGLGWDPYLDSFQHQLIGWLVGSFILSFIQYEKHLLKGRPCTGAGDRLKGNLPLLLSVIQQIIVHL